MRVSRKLLTRARRALDSRLGKWKAVRAEPVPRGGWLKATRESLGLTHRQLAQRLGVTPRSVQQLEEHEVSRTVSLSSLDRATQAMECRVVYAVVPAEHDSLEDLVTAHALALADELVRRTRHSMSLEDQAVGDEVTRAQRQELADELKRNLDRRLWGPAR
jgi:predicted DNA-binding mobile mystery protein A